MDDLKAWLNSDRNYTIGTNLYAKYGEDILLTNILNKKESNYLKRRLNKELEDLYFEKQNRTSKEIQNISENNDQPENVIPKADLLSNTYYQQANQLYKEAMNCRAVLFSLVKNINPVIDLPENQEIRRDLTIKTVTKYLKASELYDIARGKKDEPNSKTVKANPVEDYNVKNKLDNARKNFNKIKILTPNDKRNKLLSKHAGIIETLEKRWLSLQQTT
jgi:hypothetical protein